jgi:restriction system protein
MPIPTYDILMLPLLRALADGRIHQLREFYDRLADDFSLTPEQRAEYLPSGQQRVFQNRVGWARTYLKKAGLIESPRRGHILITDLGRSLLAESPDHIDIKMLERYESFQEFKNASRKEEPGEADEAILEATETPDETIEAAFEQRREQVQAELLETIKACTPYFFEKVVLRLLQAMGYGGTTGKGVVTPKSLDGGIDGIIYEDRLGLDTVCIQAKRWEGTVGRQTVQAFVGSMDLHRSKKGVVLTTGGFSRDAIDYIERIEGKKVVLIDGQELTRLMMDYRVVVMPTKSYELVDISQDFFDEDIL